MNNTLCGYCWEWIKERTFEWHMRIKHGYLGNKFGEVEGKPYE